MKDPLANPAPLIERVYAYVAYRIGAGADAEDVTSETIERALRYRDSFDPSRGDPAAWLIGIARRVIAGRQFREFPKDGPREQVQESHEVQSIHALQLTAAIKLLDERDREIIALRFGGDLTAREIGATLELRTNTVEVALHRALSRLRAALAVSDDETGYEYPAPAPDPR